MTPQERIEDHIIGPMADDACWETDFCRNHAGYPRININGRAVKVHRLAWEIANAEPIPEGMCVLHSCDNPACCNPAHLRLGTHADNMNDRTKRNRHHAKRDFNTGRFLPK